MGAIPWQSSGQDSALPLQGTWVWSRSHMPLSVAKLNESVKGAWGIPAPTDTAHQLPVPQSTQRASDMSSSRIACAGAEQGEAAQEGKLRDWKEVSSI